MSSLNFFFGEAIIVVTKLMQIHALRVVARNPPNKIVTILCCTKRCSQHMAFQIIPF